MTHVINKKEQFVKVAESLNLKFPVAEIAEKTAYSKGNISEFLNRENKKEPTRPFLMSFCKAFGLDYENLFSTKKPDADASGFVIPDPTIPGVYHRIIDELIESSKAQRKALDTIQDITHSVTRITDALLEERQQIRSANISLNTLEERAEETDATLGELKSAVVYGFAAALKKKPEEIEVMLHTGEWIGKGKTSSKRVIGN